MGRCFFLFIFFKVFFVWRQRRKTVRCSRMRTVPDAVIWVAFGPGFGEGEIRVEVVGALSGYQGPVALALLRGGKYKSVLFY